jgi:hypothetical protein
MFVVFETETELKAHLTTKHKCKGNFSDHLFNRQQDKDKALYKGENEFNFTKYV